MKENDYKPHFQKSSLAALNYLNKVYGLPNIANFSHLWPKVHAVLGRWDDHLKKNPYHAQSAGHFTTDRSCIDERIFVPCVCLEILNSDELEVKKFRNHVRLNPTTACATSCPYEIIQRYLTQIEDPYGQIAVASNSTPPRYLRARNPNSSVHNFLLRPLGNHTT